MDTKTIPLDAVKLAWVTARARQFGMSLDRFAAYTDCPLLGIDCDDAIRGRMPYRLPPCHFLPMSRGGMDRVLNRTRMEHGLQEVRRTWGAGYRSLQKEFSTSVMH